MFTVAFWMAGTALAGYAVVKLGGPAISWAIMWKLQHH